MINAATIKNKITANTGIQIGANTHHHDQAINPVNFNPMKSIASKPKNPIPPPEAVCVVLDIFTP